MLEFHGRRVCPPGARARHPAFDVTPAAKISAIITEVGVLRPPYEQSIAAALAVRRPQGGPARPVPGGPAARRSGPALAARGLSRRIRGGGGRP